MPTNVYFIGQSLMLEEDFDQVNQQLNEHEAGLFTRKDARSPVRVTVYRSAVAYIEEILSGADEPRVGFGVGAGGEPGPDGPLGEQIT